jgi:hypothetical protein
MNKSKKVKSPNILKVLLEGRSFFEAGSFFMSYPLLKKAPKGDGHPVLVLPGYLAGDASTKLIRMFLRGQNYIPYRWKLGVNFGKQSHPETGCGQGIIDRLDEIYKKHGQKVTVIGWSLGGIYARELARVSPDKVRQVISLGSPFAGHLRASHASYLFEKTSGYCLTQMGKHLHDVMPHAPPVPCTAIYTKTDGVTAWQCCLEKSSKTTQNIEVISSHCGLGHHPIVMWVIADRLAQKENQWNHFVPSGRLEKLMYKLA